MTKTKAILWRLYLTILVLLGIGAICGLGIDINTYIKNENNRKSLVQLLQKNYELADKHPTSNEKPKFIPDEDWTFLPPEADVKNLSNMQLSTIAFGANYDCLKKLANDGGGMWECDLQHGQWVDENFRKYSLNRYSDIGGSIVPVYFLVWLGVILAFLCLRYWFGWMATGTLQKRFP